MAAACRGGGSSAGAQSDGERAASALVHASAAGRWNAAQMRVVSRKGHSNLHSGVVAEILYVLVLQGREEQHVLLRRLSAYDFDTYGTPGPAFRAAAQASFRLEFAPDGHALAVSSDGGTEWRLVGLDTAGAPLYCEHRLLRGLGATGGWVSAPSSRDVAEDVLAARGVRGKPEDHGGPRFDEELLAAGDYAWQHRDEAELRLALARAFARHALVWEREPWGTLRRRVREIARGDPAVRAALLALACGAEPEAGAGAAYVLAGTDDGAALEELALAVRERMRGRGPAPKEQAWAAASLAAARRKASRPALQALLDVAQSVEPSADDWKPVRVSAVRALASLEDPAASAALQRLAVGECDQALDPWPEEFLEPDETDDTSLWHGLACWARAALARHGQA